jgi:hypothetical protein
MIFLLDKSKVDGMGIFLTSVILYGVIGDLFHGA